MFEPDCTIDLELINRKTVKQAVEKAKAEYKKLMNKVSGYTTVVGALEHDCKALVSLGNDNATLLQASNKDEQQKRTSQDEEQQSTTASQDEQQNRTSQDEQHSGTNRQQVNMKAGMGVAVAIS